MAPFIDGKLPLKIANGWPRPKPVSNYEAFVSKGLYLLSRWDSICYLDGTRIDMYLLSSNVLLSKCINHLPHGLLILSYHRLNKG